MKRDSMLWRLLAVLAAIVLLAAACGSDDDEDVVTDEPAADEPADEGDAGEEPADDAGDADEPAGDDLTPVNLQLQWFTQAQFAGYYAAVDQGFYEDVGLEVTILEGGVDIQPATVLDSGAADFAISWVPRALVPIEEGTNITNIAQVFQRSATLQVAFADAGITSPADLAGKNVGNWGGGNEAELFAGMRAAGVDPETDATLVQQQFDMLALLSGEIDAAQAMIYNEYAQVLETVNPDTGELYTADDLTVINWNDVGTAMLQDAIWADADRLEDDAAYRETAVKFVEGSIRGWAWCRDNFDACVQIVLDNAPTLGASHQAWQLNEINKLIWPSPGGAGVMDEALFDQTVEVALAGEIISAEPPDGAFRTDIAEEAVANLEAAGVDVIGSDYTPVEVTLNEGGD